ncbi:uncharacterized protein LOC122152747 isoform X2 [Tyto alba]|nr:uncharacterized protein LOC122152747 isoform X2 [Tyto alba]
MAEENVEEQGKENVEEMAEEQGEMQAKPVSGGSQLRERARLVSPGAACSPRRGLGTAASPAATLAQPALRARGRGWALANGPQRGNVLVTSQELQTARREMPGRMVHAPSGYRGCAGAVCRPCPSASLHGLSRGCRGTAGALGERPVACHEMALLRHAPRSRDVPGAAVTSLGCRDTHTGIFTLLAKPRVLTAMVPTCVNEACKGESF